MSPTPGTPTYVYGVARAARPPAGSPSGLAGRAVRILRHDGLAAVVSDYAGGVLRELPREVLLHHLLDHQRVLEWAVERGDVVPLEFGSLVDGDEEALEVLAHCRDGLAAALGAVHGCVEVEVAATWDVDRELRELAGSEVVTSARDAIVSGPAVAVEDRVRLGRLVKGELDRHRRRYLELVLDALRPVVVDSASNALLSDQMVVNVALLVNRDRRPELEARVDELERTLAPRLSFRLVAPMPPYTFSTIRVRRLERARVEAARALLGIAPQFTESDVGRAFRSRAAAAVTPGHGGTLAELREARDVLLSACPGSQPEAGGDLWVLTVRRPRVEDVEPSRFGGGE